MFYHVIKVKYNFYREILLLHDIIVFNFGDFTGNDPGYTQSKLCTPRLK